MKPRRALLLSLTLILMLCAACGGWLHRERQQYAINRQLIAALERNDAKTAIVLVNEGADPNTHYAALLAPSFRLLFNQLLHHAPSPTNASPTAFMLVCGGHLHLVHPSFLRFASVSDENLPLLQAMLVHGAEVHAQDDYHNTALHNAVRRGWLHTVQSLLQYGANINAQNYRGDTPLMGAVLLHRLDVAQFLLAQGANPNIQNANQNTALHHTVMAIRVESAIPLLLAHGADPNLPNKRGQTPLILAKELNRPDAVRLLQQHGAK